MLGMLFSSLCSCTEIHPPKPKNEKVQLAEQMMNYCAKALSERHQMLQCGDGGAMMYEIEDLFLAFTIYRQLSKEEARAILIDCAHEVISSVNQCPEIQKYLLPGGFTEKSVQIQIYIKPNKQDNYYPDLGVCSYNFGKLAFSTYDDEKPYGYKTDEEEMYQEAISHLESTDYLKNITQLKLREPEMPLLQNKI
ncbi:MAG: hypothetical protein S4CHLAM6_01880 [Chlamydiae bacterium]|nr:hypothetical protein [Chlamydiota bacterium]